MTIAISITHPKRFFGLVRRVSQTLRVKSPSSIVSFVFHALLWHMPIRFTVVHSVQPKVLTINISLRLRVSDGLVYMQ